MLFFMFATLHTSTRFYFIFHRDFKVFLVPVSVKYTPLSTVYRKNSFENIQKGVKNNWDFSYANLI